MVTDVNIPETGNKNNSERQNADFPCFCCGICCSDFQPHLDMTESKMIAEHLGISLQKFLDDCTDPRWPGTDTHLLLHKDGMCLFLEQKEGKAKWLCRIHAFKPAACREWTAGLFKKECRKGLSRYWGLSVDDSGKIIGPAKKLQSFQMFTKTLS